MPASFFGMHSLRRTKATLIYRRTGNLRAVQLLLGHTKIESTVRYLGIDVDDALGPGRDAQPVHSRLDQLLQPLLQDAVAADPEEDRSLCHPLDAPQVQAVASEDQGGARLV